jgi:hypothetical protein
MFVLYSTAILLQRKKIVSPITVFLNLSRTEDPIPKIIPEIFIKENTYELQYRYTFRSVLF